MTPCAPLPWKVVSIVVPIFSLPSFFTLKKKKRERSYYHQPPFLSPSSLLLYESVQQHMMHVQWKIHYEVIPVSTLLHKNATLIENKNINTFQETEIEL